MAMKGCGFLLPKFCLRSSLGLMNLVTGVRAKTRAAALPHRQRYHPAIKTSEDQDRPVVYVRDETWEAVFRHKLDGSKQTTESYPITYWSNSQSPNGSSSFYCSTCGGVSPDRNDLSQPSFREGKGSLGFLQVIGKLAKLTRLSLLEKALTGILLAASLGQDRLVLLLRRLFYVDSACMPETPNSKFSYVSSNVLLSPKSRDCEVGTESGTVEEKIVLQASEDEKLQNERPEVLRIDIPCAGNHLDESREDVSIDSSINAQLRDQGKDRKVAFQSLPPPLPTSPSESWLYRTLPSVSSKNPTTQSFLSMQFNSNKKVVQISLSILF